MPSQFHTTLVPKLYPILDMGLLDACGIEVSIYAKELHDAGVDILQYRNKQGIDAEILRDAHLLRTLFADTPTRLILNDRADLVAQAKFHGVHVGQSDMDLAAARGHIGELAILGVSTHTLEQIAVADATDCDCIAYGPIFATVSKDNPDPVVGLEGLRAARRATNKPLVAIGGITRANCRSVLDSGADSIAIISELLPRQKSFHAGSVQQIVEEFLALLA
ncbi:MAG TPA: thiamine phosphate synthase [Acidobacteriaceae bacterium]|nr:thiamine phosphate synthase [Acidobacteriaceae bacterium]